LSEGEWQQTFLFGKKVEFYRKVVTVVGILLSVPVNKRIADMHFGSV
jgi:hypothetical protein